MYLAFTYDNCSCTASKYAELFLLVQFKGTRREVNSCEVQIVNIL